MQVNNNVQSPNFGMALRIKPGAVAGLKTKSRETINEIQRIAEELKDTQFYHLVLGENGERIIVSPYANKYVGGTLKLDKLDDNFIAVKMNWAGMDVSGVKYGEPYGVAIRFADTEAAKKAYGELLKTSGIKSDAMVVRYLDDAEKIRQAEEAARQKERSEIAQMVDDLFEKYGLES